MTAIAHNSVAYSNRRVHLRLVDMPFTTSQCSLTLHTLVYTAANVTNTTLLLLLL
jgi:hypothetical protein